MPDKRPSVKNEDQYEALKEEGMSKERAAKIANTPGASRRGGKKSGSGSRRSTSKQGAPPLRRRRPVAKAEGRRPARGPSPRPGEVTSRQEDPVVAEEAGMEARGPKEMGVDERTPDFSRIEGAQILADQARESLRREGLTD